MIFKTYEFLTTLSVGITLSFATAFIYLKIPDSEFLNSYRKSRNYIAGAYFIMSILNALELIFNDASSDILFTRAVTVVISSWQTILFTYTFICLLSPIYFQKHKIYKEIILIIFLSLTLFATFVFSNINVPSKALHISLLLYGIMLIRNTRIFLKIYKHYNLHFDNYFSDNNNERIKWILYSFFSGLAIGTGALLLSFSDNLIHYNLFTICFTSYYAYFGIKFINYTYEFKNIQRVIIQPESSLLKAPKISVDYEIQQAIEKWINDGGYLKPNLTIARLSHELNTNRTYLSQYINNKIGMTFRDWINSNRISMAKELLLINPKLSIMDIALKTGYTDSSNFNKQFVKQTGTSAKAWQSQQLKIKSASCL